MIDGERKSRLDPNELDTVPAPDVGLLALPGPSSDGVPLILRGEHTASSGTFDRSDRYRTGGLLGSGGMGTVHLYGDRRIGREVALKRMHQPVAHGETRARFLREARVQGQLEHPAIVPVYDLDVSADGELYFTMRRVQGKTLAQVLADLAAGKPAMREQWSQRKLLSAFVQVCFAVHYAHSKGVVHRNLKPGNIMLGDFGEVYVLDWGLARISDDELAMSLTEPSHEGTRDVSSGVQEHHTHVGTMLGTPLYMSPEQFRGDADIDARTDIYALGLTLYEILALEPYRRGKNFATIRLSAMVGEEAHPSRVAPETPPELDALCAQATAPDAANRLASAREIASALEQFLDGERDLEQRRALASKAALRAREALEASEQATNDQRREELHTAAMRDVVSALALDEKEPDARRTMVRLLTEAPPSLPPAVQREVDLERDAARQRGLRLARWAWLSWLLTIPAVLALGVRSTLPFAVMCGLVAIGTALCFEAARRAHLDRLRAFGLAVVTAALVSGVSMWLGPFVLLPVVASSLLMLIMSQSRPGERRALFAIALLVVATPLALEWAGVIPSSYAFVDGQLRLLPRALELRPGPTLAMLVWSTLGFGLLPAHLLARLRDQLDAAQTRLALQSWQLRQLGREAAHDTTAAAGR